MCRVYGRRASARTTEGEDMSKTVKVCSVLVAALVTFAFAQAWAATPQDLAKEAEAKCVATAKDKPSAEAIMAKVDKAAALLEKEGAAAFPKFRGGSSEFVFGGTYVWVHDLTPVMLVHPIKYQMEGTNIATGNKLPDGRELFIMMNKEVERKGGSCWVHYLWPKPGQTTSAQKMSYLKLAKKGDKSYVVGCGSYDLTLSDVEKLAKK